METLGADIVAMAAPAKTSLSSANRALSLRSAR
jgi:hypothetical protein